MAKRTVRLRARAATDVQEAVDHYQREAGKAISLDFIASLEQTVRRIRTSPHLGSLRFAHELDIPELRVIDTKRFPYLVFYLVDGDTIDIWRVLHSRRDLPSTLADGR